MSGCDVSVLMPIFGQAPYLDEALDSVALEVGSAREVGIRVESVLILDRPSAATRDRVFDFLSRNPDTQVIESGTPGLVPALNLGLSCVNSALVARFDSDDVMLPGRLATQVHAFEDDPDLVLIGGQIRRWSRNRVVSTSFLPLEHDGIVRKLRRGRHAISHSSCMFRIDSVRKLGGYRKLAQAEDWDLYLRLASVGRLANLAQAVTLYRFHEWSITGRDAHLTQQGIQQAITIHRFDKHGAALGIGELPHHLTLRRRLRVSRRAKAQILYRRALCEHYTLARAVFYLVAGLMDAGAAAERVRQMVVDRFPVLKLHNLRRERTGPTPQELSA